MADSAFLTRVVLKNYKSSAACAVRLHPLVFLVGRNGAGKSNFLDALRFVADALRTSLDHAVRDRGGINEVRRRSGRHPNTFGIRLEFRLRSGTTGLYAFRIAARPHGRYAVQEEECELRGSGILDRKEVRSFRVQDARLTLSPSITPAPVAVDDRLYLVNAAGIPDSSQCGMRCRTWAFTISTRTGYARCSRQIRASCSPEMGATSPASWPD